MSDFEHDDKEMNFLIKVASFNISENKVKSLVSETIYISKSENNKNYFQHITRIFLYGDRRTKIFKIFEDSDKFTTKILGHTNEALFPIQAKDFIHGKGFEKNQIKRRGLDLFVLAPLFPFLVVAGTVTKLENQVSKLSKKSIQIIKLRMKKRMKDVTTNLLSKYTKDCLIDLVR